MNRQHLLPLVELERLKRRHDLDARVRHQYVDAVELVGHGLEARFDCFFAGHVHGDGHRAHARRIELRGHGLRCGQVEVGDDDLRTVVEINLGNLFADATRSARNDCDLVLHILHAHAMCSSGDVEREDAGTLRKSNTAGLSAAPGSRAISSCDSVVAASA